MLLAGGEQGWGRTVILGGEWRGTPLGINPLELVKGRTVTGSLFGGLKPKTDIPLLAQKYLAKVGRHRSWMDGQEGPL